MYKDEVEQEVIDLHKCLQNTVLHKDRQFKQQNIKFSFSSNENNKSVFIKGKYSNFVLYYILIGMFR
ncbi:MAG: hypothetical protein LBC22_03565 [Endomicrobium sp.]|jgi:hypothetical protein|nr:hypothetical protein [Endomicrobium sp.]